MSEVSEVRDVNEVNEHDFKTLPGSWIPQV